MRPIKIILLLPISMIYGFFVFVRNKLFDWGILKEKAFNIAIIGTGNLSTGGTGKTPHVEYLIDLLKERYKIATLSRGYGRKTKGYIKANQNSTYLQIGDEPVQYRDKYPDITVAVCERRVKGIKQLITKEKPDVIVLDDSFQHRHVKPGLNILLTDFYKLYSDNFILPSGSLREFRSGAKRADIIVVTKTDPVVFSPMIKDIIYKKLKIQSYQKLYFSYIQYLQPISFHDISKKLERRPTTIFMISGIANPYPFQEHLRRQCMELCPFIFRDHHDFTKKEISDILKEFSDHLSPKKVIITTEKDSKRLNVEPFKSMLAGFPVYYVPIRIAFHKNNENLPFDTIIKDFMEKRK